VNLSFRGFARRLIHTKAQRYVREFCDALGLQRLEWMVANRRELREFVTPELQQKINLAPQHPWVADAITDQEFAAMLPSWAVEIVRRHGAEGEAWLNSAVDWLRSLFSPPTQEEVEHGAGTGRGGFHPRRSPDPPATQSSPQ